MTWAHPFSKTTITSRFGDTANRSSPHRGLDYAPGAQQIIPAVTAGRVVNIFYSSCLGWVCEVKENEHDIFIGYSHLYCNKHRDINCDGTGHDDGSTCMQSLKVGDLVEAGQPVGRIGTSGTCSTGPHLHLTFAKEKDPRYAKTFDPEKFIDQKEDMQNANTLPAKEEAQEITPEQDFWAKYKALTEQAPDKPCPTCGRHV